MYGVVEIGGHQYKVKAGDLIDVQKLEAQEGSNINFEKVLFVGGDNPTVGSPTVAGAKISAKVLKHDKSRKKLVFKRRPGAWQKIRGHRQEYTALLITEMVDGKGNTSKIDANSKAAQKFLKK